MAQAQNNTSVENHDTSRLDKLSVSYRNSETTKNKYSYNDEYNVGNPDALSTGDELGKGEFNGKIGSATDIATRTKLTTKNEFNYNKEYNSGTA